MSMRAKLGVVAAILCAGGVATADEGETEQPRPAPSKFGPFVKVQAGYTFREIYGVPIDSGTVAGGIGARLGVASLYLEGTFLFGATRAGLRVQDFDVGPTVELTAWRFRIGGGLYIGSLTVSRVTDTGSALTAVDLGGRLHVTFDLIEWGDRVYGGRAGGLFLGVQGSLTSAGGSAYGGPTFMLGVRLF